MLVSAVDEILGTHRAKRLSGTPRLSATMRRTGPTRFAMSRALRTFPPPQPYRIS
jgi:hypothetical protein